MDNASTEIYWLDSEARIRYVNNQVCKTLGYSKQELLQLSIPDIDPQFPTAQWEQHWDSLKRDHSQTLETCHRRKNGDIFPVEIIANHVQFGNLEYNVAYAKDISERKQTEAIAHRNKLILETAKDGFWRIDSRGFVCEANQSYADMIGYTLAELVAMHISQLDAYDRPEDVKARIDAIVASGRLSFETRHRHKDGHLVEIEVSATFYPPSGEFYVFCRDISARKAIEAALRYSKQQYERLAANIPVGVFMLHTSATGVYTFKYISPRFCALYGLSAEELYFDPHSRLRSIHPDDRAEFIRLNRLALQTHSPFCWEGRTLIQGKIAWLRIESKPDLQADGSSLWDGVVSDISAQKLAQDELRVAAVTFESHDGIMITGVDGSILRVNSAFEKITGYAAGEVLGLNPRILSSGRQSPEFYRQMWGCLGQQGNWSGEIWNRRKDGQIYPLWMTVTAVKDEVGRITEYVAIFSDTTTRKRVEEEIRNLAFYDTLTRLPNRRLLNDRLIQAMAASKRSGLYAATMFLDLDNFKPLNDTHGHAVGDLLLVEVGLRLKNCVRDMDTVARFGGDEFVVILGELSAEQAASTAQALWVAEKILSALSAPYQLALSNAGKSGTIEHRCTASIGLALFTNHQGSADDIVKWADEAMYLAKQAGRNSIRCHEKNTLQGHA